MILDTNKNILDIIQREVDYARCVYPDDEIEIELGRSIMLEIIFQTYDPNYMLHRPITVKNDDVYTYELYGIPVHFNDTDPYVFKIWRNIL